MSSVHFVYRGRRRGHPNDLAMRSRRYSARGEIAQAWKDEILCQAMTAGLYRSIPDEGPVLLALTTRLRIPKASIGRIKPGSLHTKQYDDDNTLKLIKDAFFPEERGGDGRVAETWLRKEWWLHDEIVVRVESLDPHG